MPQPPLQVENYLATPLPQLRDQYPPGTGGTGVRSEGDIGNLQGIEVIEGLDEAVNQYISSLPSTPIPAHPSYKYPKFVQAIKHVPTTLKSSTDLQKCLSSLPLAAISAVLTAQDADPEDLPTGTAQNLDQAGYESDGGEEDVVPKLSDKTKPWYWQFNKSPLGSGEFFLKRQGSDDVPMIVRTINPSAFTQPDWDEFIVTGPYHYSTKSKASFYWWRQLAATRRVGCQHFVLTDWQRWTFGCFNADKSHAWISPIMDYDHAKPSVMQALFFWAKTSMGKTSFKLSEKDVSSLPKLFPDNPARRVGTSTSESGKVRGVKGSNESDIEESDVEES